MSNIPYNSLKATSTATQMRNKMELKLKKKLGEQRIIGPLDPYIKRACDEGLIDEVTRDKLIQISLYCEDVLLTSNATEIPPFDTLLEWSKFIDEF
ncbi:MAG: hypothetical protein J5813_06320 [Candidatus Methanomethylophilaceae archaeon]|nr:hypothetical protein [Candidatus Methanomethylophilaceae archaeon]